MVDANTLKTVTINELEKLTESWSGLAESSIEIFKEVSECSSEESELAEGS